MANANETLPAKCTHAPGPCEGSQCAESEKARIAEVNRIAEHFGKHPEKCCCHTYLGRACCMAPIHGDIYRAICIENGDRFYVEFRAKSREEAKELGQEHASEWGGECISVSKVK